MTYCHLDIRTLAAAFFALILSATIFIPKQATAAPITAGDVVLTPAPTSLVHSAFESDDTIALVKERSNFLLTGDLPVDVIGIPGSYDDFGDFSGGIIPMGTIVSSHILHFDPVGTATPAATTNGSATFDQTVLALIFTQSTLDGSDFLGTSGTTYGGSFRGFELLPASPVGDLVALSNDQRTVTVDFGATIYYDELRVLTRVPEPSPLALSIALVTISLVKRSRC